MPLKRVHIALDEGLLSLPEPYVLNAPPGCDIGTRCNQAFFPSFVTLKARGYSVTPTPVGPFTSALVQCHRSRAMTFHHIRLALLELSPGTTLAINGDKSDGIEAILRELRKRFGEVGVFSKAHGKLVWLTRPTELPDVDDWKAEQVSVGDGFVTFPGVFSADKPDKGSVLLCKHLPSLAGHVADLGSGWGFLSRHILQSGDVSTLDMVEADHHAVEMAKLNVQDARARHHWADATQFAGVGLDAVVSNPPFHTSRKADPSLGQAFIRRAAAVLKPRGALWMVANRNLPYEAVLDEEFQVVKTVAQDAGFKVIHAQSPKTSRKTR